MDWSAAQRSVLRIRQQLSRRRKVWDYHGCRSFARHPTGRDRCLADDVERTEACFGIRPKWLAADSAYGSASNLDWLVNEQGIAPHVPGIDKSQREDGTFSR